MNKQFLYFIFGSYKKKGQNTKRNRVFSAKLGFFARFLNMSVTFFLLMYLILPLTATAQIVNIPDLNLRAAVETALGKVSGATITTDEMATLTRLDASDAGIHDLNGLEAAINLTELQLGNNSIADISALGSLTQLTTLNLGDNSILDISALAGLINLRILYLSGNSVSDISVLGGLTQLTTLDVGGNSVSDISVLGSLTQLTTLDVGGSSVSDISVLGGLINLRTLYLRGSSVSDISVLGGLTQLTRLSLWDNSISDISALGGLTQLTTLNLGGNSISDISALGGLTQLTRLNLWLNLISDISALGGLTELTWLNLTDNLVSDISPLVANTGLGNGDTVNLRENRLSALSFDTHIPTLRSRGVTVEAPAGVWSFGDPHTVRLIYFLPNDRQPQPDIDTKMDTLIKEVQQFYADQMESHGFGRKTFRFETDATGKAVVHRMNGKFNSAHYQNYSRTVWPEIWEQFNRSRTIYLCALEITAIDNQWAGIGGGSSLVGAALISGGFNGRVIAHELGHTFGLQHDFRNDAYIMGYGGISGGRLSECAAEWLDVHRYFNTKQSSQDARNTTVQMFPPSLASPPNAIRFRFEVTDPDGLYQGQLLTPGKAPSHFSQLIACKRLTGTSNTVEFVTTELGLEAEFVSLRLIDVHGNITVSERYPIDIISLLPAPEVVSIPDASLAAAVRASLGLAPGDTLTSHAMLELRALDLSSITDLTGLEYAPNLTELSLYDSSISDLSTLEGLTQLTSLILGKNSISDISALGGLTQLTELHFWSSPLSDLSILEGLTQLTELHLYRNSLSDLSTLEGLTQLTSLNLDSNSISDISALGGLIELTMLELGANSVSDISALEGLTQLTSLNLDSNSISDISALGGLIELTMLELGANSVSDISALGSLTKLTSLDVGGNSVSDISALGGLTELTHLSLWYNSVSDISALAGLTELTWLNLWYNLVSDISALDGLTELTTLNLEYNSVSDISALGGLTELTWLNLTDNLVSDVSPLVANTGLGSGNEIHLVGNPLSHTSINTHIPILQSRGVTVKFDDEAYPALLKISGDNQTGAADTVLSDPFVVEMQDENGSTVAGASITFTVVAGGGMLSVTNTRTDEHGRAQSTLTLGPNLGTNTVSVSASGIESPATFHAISSTESPLVAADVNNDGLVNVLDLIMIASNLGQAGQDDADVNGDGVITVLDLVMVAGLFDVAAAAPAAHLQVSEAITAVEVQGWLTNARGLETKDPLIKRGVMMLEQLLATLTPKETELLANYPNPFNPETWIPYRLAEDTFVTLTIYDGGGQVVRTLEVGHRIASAYENRSKAIYWDGRNDLGEGVASGVYFYHLSAGDYSATRKMLILK